MYGSRSCKHWGRVRPHFGFGISRAARAMSPQAPRNRRFDRWCSGIKVRPRIWNEALPIGNGRLGAMVFGGTARSASSSTRTRSGPANDVTAPTPRH